MSSSWDWVAPVFPSSKLRMSLAPLKERKDRKFWSFGSKPPCSYPYFSSPLWPAGCPNTHQTPGSPHSAPLPCLPLLCENTLFLTPITHPQNPVPFSKPTSKPLKYLSSAVFLITLISSWNKHCSLCCVNFKDKRHNFKNKYLEPPMYQAQEVETREIKINWASMVNIVNSPESMYFHLPVSKTLAFICLF